MMNDTLKLTDDQVLVHARDLLQAHLPLAADGSCCTTVDLLNVLLGIAANRGTLEAVCTDWATAPDPETVRRYLNEQLCVEDLPELEQRLNAALQAEMPRRVRRQAREVAIDFHDRPYYGKQPQGEGLWVRGKARDGTTRFYRIATAYVLLNGLRVTLALRFVLPEMEIVSLLDNLLKSLKKQGFQIACLFLDKGFASIAVMDYLTQIIDVHAVCRAPVHKAEAVGDEHLSLAVRRDLRTDLSGAGLGRDAHRFAVPDPDGSRVFRMDGERAPALALEPCRVAHERVGDIPGVAARISI